MAPRKTKVLAVDDDVRILRIMRRIMELEGHQVIEATGGEEALNLFAEENPDLVLLDIMMPDLDGYTICKRIREFSTVPIIMVTAKGNDEEKVKGLDSGADDYVAKPFSFDELAARVRAVLRRSNLWEKSDEPAYSFQGLVIDFSRQRVILKNQELELTATEYHLLAHLARNAGRILTPDQILASVWGDEYIGEHHLLQVNIANLRRKLGDDRKSPTFIQTRHGMGYMFARGQGND
ncbi:MAG: response regulator transcription factor [Dehalococcoidia bacterium]